LLRSWAFLKGVINPERKKNRDELEVEQQKEGRGYISPFLAFPYMGRESIEHSRPIMQHKAHQLLVYLVAVGSCL